jgi:uncharacterized protein with HEPN domain
MTDKTPKLLVDALGAIGLAQEFVAGCTLRSYSADKMRRSAVVRQLEILGEACARMAKLGPAWVTQVANLKLAIDLRNRIIHGYDSGVAGVLQQGNARCGVIAIAVPRVGQRHPLGTDFAVRSGRSDQGCAGLRAVPVMTLVLC